MQPNSEIVALAREFHELGGTKGIKNLNPCYFLEPDDPAVYSIRGRYYHPLKDIPILDESELEALLWKWGYYKVNRDFKGYYLQKHNSTTGAWDVISVEIKADNLHSALYAAAVWVAKERK